MAPLKVALVLLMVSSSSAMLDMLFSGCESTLVKMKMGQAQQCVMGQLQDLQVMMEQFSKSSGNAPPNPNALLERLKDDNMRGIVVPSIAQMICQKRVKLLECSKYIVALNCMEDLKYIGMKLALKILIRPVFKYTCEEIVDKENGVVNLISCAMSVFPAITKCKPEVTGLKKVEEICGIMGYTYNCATKLMMPTCNLTTVHQLNGLVGVINDAIGCTFPFPKVLPSSGNTIQTVSANRSRDKTRTAHVNVNQFYRSNDACRLSNVVAIVLPIFIMAAFR